MFEVFTVRQAWRKKKKYGYIYVINPFIVLSHSPPTSSCSRYLYIYRYIYNTSVIGTAINCVHSWPACCRVDFCDNNIALHADRNTKKKQNRKPINRLESDELLLLRCSV